jgi:tetratricopeptide (TPR) repeat protein
MAREIYPDDNDLSRSEISLLIQTGKTEEATQNLAKQIEAEPDDPNLYFTQGILNEELAAATEDEAMKATYMEKARASYMKAIEVDPTHYNSQYNIGVMIIQEANEVIKERNNLGVSKEDLKRADELAPVIDEKLKAALPQWEKIYELKKDDQATLETLQYLYTQLKMYDKVEEIMSKLDAISGN